MYEVVGYCLLVDMGNDGPIPDGVYVFHEKSEAIEFAVDKLNDCDKYKSILIGEFNDTFLEDFQEGLGITDYYHIREVRKAF